MNGDWHATYRLQLHSDFPLALAEQQLPYLARLGISHVYLSPCLQAAPGSRHGYDVTDPTRINDDLGGEADWQSFCRRARAHGLGVLLDIVPNHMAATAQNPWWDDLLAHGPASDYFAFFDVRRDPRDPHWRVHLATLGRDYGPMLADGELRIVDDGPRPRVAAPGQSWPLAPATWRELCGDDPAARGIFDRLADLGRRPELTARDRVDYRQACGEADAVWTAQKHDAAKTLERLNRDPARLHALLEQQSHSLHYWKREGEVANYRRFFDVGSLVGVRMEEPEVFRTAHRRIAAMISSREIQGVRVDHPDGLKSPQEYFRNLRSLIPGGRIYVEKILENDERLPADWPVDGTVGYDFLSKVNRLWMDEQKSDALSAIYADFTGDTVNLPHLVREKKAQILASSFDADLARLTELAVARARADWRTHDLSRHHIRDALAAVSVLLPVYRTYRDQSPPSPFDQKILHGVFALARSRHPAIDSAVFAFLEQIFLGPGDGPLGAELIARWQQVTPAVMAKGVEDTTFYCYDRLVACNEVGGQASLLGISSEKFHEFCHHLAENWPDTMLATSTHDNKRSEDVRARICVLTECCEQWSAALEHWSALNLPAWQGRAPDRHLEYLLYQTLVGAWPIDLNRAWSYVLKAVREAKIHTSWREPSPTYEDSVRKFLEGLYASREFLASLEEFVRPLIQPGRVNGLAQTLIKLTAPGVPDFYQGTELWELSLVDPDNRRPVDFRLRQETLAQLENAPAAEALRDWDSGRPKLWLIARTLALRRTHPEWFKRGGTYRPFTAHGLRLAHLLGFVRAGRVLVLVPRFSLALNGEWEDTRVRLPDGEWTDWLTGSRIAGEVPAAKIFEGFPVALLVHRP